MACGATLKRHHEFDPLQTSPGSKRICLQLPIDHRMSPSSASHNRLLNGSAFVEAAQKLIHDKLAARMSPSQEKQNISNALLQPNISMSSPLASQLWPAAQSPISQAWPTTQSPLAGRAWSNSCRPIVSRPAARKEQLFTMKQVEMMCRNIVKEHEERVREEFDNILANKLAEQYEGLLSFNQTQIHNRFDNSDATYVS